MAVFIGRVCFDRVGLRTLPVCYAFHTTTKQHYAPIMKRPKTLPQVKKRIKAANVLPRPSPSNKFDDIRGDIEPLNNDSQFE